LKSYVLEKLYECPGNTSCDRDHLGTVELGGTVVLTEAARAGQPCIAAKMNYLALPICCEVKRVLLLPDISVRFKGLFVAVPQIAINCSNVRSAIPQD
jgi:hypothetical protein